ncbi:MAG: flavin reductase family protein [Lentisphaeria bacterium]|jgi:flavin reductase (DIM6/NTAB) family NADH-FMN oxidoreductase RutF|nr:flavin reductase family protein [Lentisphaeria bacterium]
MDAKDKETALKMIPYGLYVLTTRAADGRISAATVNWVTQSSFVPPLVVVGVKAESGSHQIIKETQSFALNILGKDHVGAAYAFFKPVEPEGDTIGGEPFREGSTGSPILESVPAYVEWWNYGPDELSISVCSAAIT